VDGTKSRHLTF